MSFFKQFRRVAALFDKSAWLLMLPTFAALLFVDPPLFKTLIMWTVYGVSIAGVAIIISRLVFPQIHLSDLYDEVLGGNTAAAIVVSAIVLFVALVIIALVMWAKT